MEVGPDGSVVTAVKGVVFNLFEEVVVQKGGDDLWDCLLDKAGLQGVYTSLGSYPDADLFGLVAAASEELGVPADEVVRWFGRTALPLLAQSYPQFFAPHTSTRSLVLALNDIIHPEVRKFYPGVDVPMFDFDASSDQVLVMGYASPRKLCAFAEGLIEGTAAHYGERVVDRPAALHEPRRQAVRAPDHGRQAGGEAAVTGTVEPCPQQVERLSRRLERERLARRDAELISERSIRELYEQRTALELLKTVAATCNEAATIGAAMQGAVDQVCGHTGWPLGHALLLDREAGELVTTRTWHLAVGGRFDPFREVTERTRFGRGVGLPGRVLASGRPAWIIDVTRDANFPRAPAAQEVGLKAAFAFPVLSQAECVAVLEFFSPQSLEPDEALLELMGHIGLQLGRVVERKWGEQDLARLGHRTQVLLSSAGEGIFGAAADGRTSFVNPAAARMLGWEPDTLTGRSLHEVVHAHPVGVPGAPRRRLPAAAVPPRAGRAPHRRGRVLPPGRLAVPGRLHHDPDPRRRRGHRRGHHLQ